MTIWVAARAVAEYLILGAVIEHWQARQAARKRFHARDLVGRSNTTPLSAQLLFQRLQHCLRDACPL